VQVGPPLSQYNGSHAPYAKVAELADALDLGSSGETRGGSSPPFRTINLFPASASSYRPVNLSGPYEIRVDGLDGDGNPISSPYAAFPVAP
jgi:hypothetical protein